MVSHRRSFSQRQKAAKHMVYQRYDIVHFSILYLLL